MPATLQPPHEHSLNLPSPTPNSDPNDGEQPFADDDTAYYHGERDEYEMDCDGNVAPDISNEADEKYCDYHLELEGTWFLLLMLIHIPNRIFTQVVYVMQRGIFFLRIQHLLP
jgi:hypothetical protein